MELVIASSNTQKVFQIREALKELLPNASVLSLFDFPDYVLPESDEALSVAENAQKKAEHAALALDKCCLAEEWQLILPALGTKAKALFTQGNQIKNILNALAGKSEHERSAYIECSIAYKTPAGKERVATGRMEGVIAESEKGKGSNDFESIFIKHDYIKTIAELSPSVRAKISPRRKALEKLLPFLECAIS